MQQSQHTHIRSHVPSRCKLALAALGGVSLLALSAVAAHADPTLSELAAELRELKASNAQMRAENRQMKAAIQEMRGQRVRAPRGASRDYAERTPAPIPPAAGGAVPVMVTPDKRLQVGGITITPGGFLAGESVFRSKTTNSDINSAWNSIPYVNTPLSRTNEYRLTGRQSRLALLAEGAITPSVIASGYAEFDFLGAGTTSNATDTNSYAPRIRQLYAALDMTDYGIHAMAGQMWSLATLNSKGITPRNEITPPTIDGQFLPGFVFARQAGVRLTKDFDRKLWLSLALEEAQTTFTNGACSGSALSGTTNGAGEAQSASGVGIATPSGLTALCAATASGAGFSQYGQPYSLNHLPDIIGKAAYEARIANRDVHIEGMGLYKDLYDASYTPSVLTATAGAPATGIKTHDVGGYGFGGGLIAPVLPKTLDFQISALAGRGIGRYGAGLLPDATVGVNGQLRAIGEVIGLAGFTLHATPSIDLYAFGGLEREGRSYGNYDGTLFGYGLPNAANYGCNLVGANAATCTGQTHQLWQLTGGFWDKLYKGTYGEVRVGAQYSYTQRDGFGTQVTTAPTAVQAASAGLTVAQASRYVTPKTNEHGDDLDPLLSVPVAAAVSRDHWAARSLAAQPFLNIDIPPGGCDFAAVRGAEPANRRTI